MKKRIFALCGLLLALCLASGALAAPNDASLFAEQGVQSIASWDGALYALTSEGLYRYQAGDEAPELLGALPEMGGDEASFSNEVHISGGTQASGLTFSGRGEGGAPGRPNVLVPGDDALYGLDSASGVLYKLTWAGGALQCDPAANLDWSEMSMQVDGYGMTRQIDNPRVSGGSLYLLRQEDDYMTYRLARFDLQSGACTLYKAAGVVDFALYKNGSALVAVQDPEYVENDALYIMNLESGEMQRAAEMRGKGCLGLEYDAQSDTAYYIAGGEIFACPNLGPAQSVAYAPTASSLWRGAQTALVNGYYAYLDNEALQFKNLDSAYKPERALKISGLFSDDVATAFMREHPEIPLIMDMNSLDMEQFAQGMVSGAQDGADLFALWLSYSNFEALCQKGYAGDLSGSAALTEAIAQMYPQVRELLQKDGKLYAFPRYLSGTSFGYCPKLFEKIGLSEADVPKNYGELLAFIDRWEAEYAEQYPELTLFENPDKLDLKGELFGAIFSNYVYDCERRGEELRFDTPRFRDLLSRLENTDFSGFKQPTPEESQGASSGVVAVTMVSSSDGEIQNTALFTRYQDAVLSDYNFDNGYEPMPLALDADSDPLIAVDLGVLMLNAASPNADLALQFLEYYAQHMPAALRANLMPAANEPVRDPAYDATRADLQNQLDELNEALEKARGTAGEQELKLQVESMEKTLEMIKKQEYRITQEDLDEYRARFDSLYFSRGNVFTAGSEESKNEMGTLVQRYADGQLPADQFIKELDKKVRMMAAENR